MTAARPGAVAALLVVCAVTASGLCQTLAVDVSGGPLTLPEEVTTAIETWSEASDQELDLSVADDGEVVLGFGEAALLGPDTLSLTLQTSNQEGSQIEVRLNPTTYRSVPGVIEHELGILLGLTPTTAEAVLNPSRGPESPSAPTAADRGSLKLIQITAPEDVTRDGLVDFYDLAALAAAFGNQGINLAADLNRDGVVDDADLEILRDAYVFTPPSRSAPEASAPIFGEPPSGPEVPLPDVPEVPLSDDPVPEGDPTDDPISAP